MEKLIRFILLILVIIGVGYGFYVYWGDFVEKQNNKHKQEATKKSLNTIQTLTTDKKNSPIKKSLAQLEAEADIDFSAEELAEINEENLGMALFFDKNLSKMRSMSCATCHDPSAGFSDHRESPANKMVSISEDKKKFGTRNAPTVSYAALSPKFYYSKKNQEYVGGQFLDGRSATLADQAGGPPLNPIEMQMPDKASVVERLLENPFYIVAFKKIYGKNIWQDKEKAYKSMTLAIQAFEKTDEFLPFDSKYDKFLRGEYDLTILEDLGRSLFFSPTNVNCSTCHKLKFEDSPREPFTNYEYRNIGVPKNHAMLALNNLDASFIDHGLLENPAVTDKANDGKFKTPTLRNVAVTAPYMHNGIFQDLRTVVLFYDKFNNPKRQINPETGKPWGPAEVPETVAHDELNSKILTDRKVDALIAFMRILTDEKYEHLLPPFPEND